MKETAAITIEVKKRDFSAETQTLSERTGAQDAAFREKLAAVISMEEQR